MSNDHECETPQARGKRRGKQSTRETGGKVNRGDQSKDSSDCFEVPCGDYEFVGGNGIEASIRGSPPLSAYEQVDLADGTSDKNTFVRF